MARSQTARQTRHYVSCQLCVRSLGPKHFVMLLKPKRVEAEMLFTVDGKQECHIKVKKKKNLFLSFEDENNIFG